MKKYDLEDRLVRFAGEIILFTNKLPDDFTGQHLKGQIIRSATSTALNFGEAQGADTNKDAIHKNSIVLKELKETRVSWKVFLYIDYGGREEIEILMKEGEELIAIISTIIKNKKKAL